MGSLDVHLISQFLEFSLDGVDGGKLWTFVNGLYVLCVFLSFDLDDRRFSENHKFKITDKSEPICMFKYFYLPVIEFKKVFKVKNLKTCFCFYRKISFFEVN